MGTHGDDFLCARCFYVVVCLLFVRGKTERGRGRAWGGGGVGERGGGGGWGGGDVSRREGGGGTLSIYLFPGRRDSDLSIYLFAGGTPPPLDLLTGLPSARSAENVFGVFCPMVAI